MTTETNWWRIHTNLANLAEWMHREDWDFSEILEMLRRPWKYDAEWAEYGAYTEGQRAAIRDRIELESLT